MKIMKAKLIFAFNAGDRVFIHLLSHRGLVIWAGLISILIFADNVSAQEETQAPQEGQTPTGADTTSANLQDAKDNLEISGLVLDRTITKWGRDFYDLFYSRWQTQSGESTFRYNIVITEQIRPLFRLWVQVTVNDTPVFEQHLIPRGDIIEQAVGLTLTALRQDLNRQAEDMRDLNGGDLSGDGIY